jgi:hypothetical protein
MNFGVKKFTVKKCPPKKKQKKQKKKTLMFEHYSLVDPMEWRGVTFWG